MASNQVLLLTSINKKLSRKVRLNRNRKLRRKRNKKFFLLKLKAKREARSTDSLCEKIADFFEYEGEQMEQTMNFHTNGKQTSGRFASSLQDVAEWQNQHQVAYWKSKALALQVENQMLHKHMKFLYDRQMHQYLSYKDAGWMEVTSDGTKQQKEAISQRVKNNVTRNGPTVNSVAEEMDEMSLPPTEQPGEARRKRLVEMYGSHAAKINGMETAMQLNFDHCVNKEKVPYWPNIPLRP